LEKQKEHFCWVKLIYDAGTLDAAAEGMQSVPETGSGKESKPPGRSNEVEASTLDHQAAESSESYSTLSGSRPPGHDWSWLAGSRPPHGIRFFSGGRPPGLYAGAVLAGWWNLDHDYDGVKSSRMRTDFHPIVGNREEAIEWLTCDEGKKWLADAMTYFLFCFTITGDW